jgi:hypothetical protein
MIASPIKLDRLRQLHHLARLNIVFINALYEGARCTEIATLKG